MLPKLIGGKRAFSVITATKPVLFNPREFINSIETKYGDIVKPHQLGKRLHAELAYGPWTAAQLEPYDKFVLHALVTRCVRVKDKEEAALRNFLTASVGLTGTGIVMVLAEMGAASSLVGLGFALGGGVATLANVAEMWFGCRPDYNNLPEYQILSGYLEQMPVDRIDAVDELAISALASKCAVV